MSRLNKSMTSSLSINTHRQKTHIHTRWSFHTYTHTQAVRHQSGPVVMSFHLSFIFILQFHHSLSACFSSPLFLFSPLIVFHHLSIAPLFCFSFKLAAFLSVSFPLISTLSRSPRLSLRLAVFIFQSFISTNVRQCFCPPSIDPRREKEMGRKKAGREKTVGWGQRQGTKQKERFYRWGNKRYEKQKEKEKAGWKRAKGGEGREYFNHSFSQITDSSPLLLYSPLLSLATPLLCCSQYKHHSHNWSIDTETKRTTVDGWIDTQSDRQKKAVSTSRHSKYQAPFLAECDTVHVLGIYWTTVEITDDWSTVVSMSYLHIWSL